MGQVLHMNNQLPTLYIPYPRCGHCDEDVTIEDGDVWCEGCLISWSDVREDVEAIPDSAREGSEVPCGIVAGKQGEPHDDNRGNHYVPGPPQPCILPSGHKATQHLCPYDVEVTKLDVASEETP